MEFNESQGEGLDDLREKVIKRIGLILLSSQTIDVTTVKYNFNVMIGKTNYKSENLYNIFKELGEYSQICFSSTVKW